MAPFVSIIVPTYERCEGLRRLLGALAAQSCALDLFEVLVVDDGSTDGTRDMLAGLALPYRLHVLAQPNQGPGAARNRGVGHANGELVLFLDDDMVPLPGLVEAHVLAHRADGAAAPRVAIGPMLPAPDWKMAPWAQWEADLLQAQYADLAAGAYACGPRQFYTANASLRRARFVEAGGFDVRYRRAEDVELAYRLRDRGAHFAFLPDAAALHYASRTFAA